MDDTVQSQRTHSNGARGSAEDDPEPHRLERREEQLSFAAVREEFVRVLRLRATRTRRTALILLVLMIAAIAGGGFAFYNAGQLVLHERVERLSAARTVLDQLREGAIYAANTLDEDLKALRRTVDDMAPPSGDLVRAAIRENDYDRMAQVVRELLTPAEGGALSAAQAKLKQDLVDVENNIEAKIKAEEKYQEALRVEGSKPHEGDDRAKQEDMGPGGSLDAIMLRATIALLLIFLVQILSALQRYNVQVAAHYEALADAFLLSAESRWRLQASDFDRLIDAMRPNACLGKAPRTVPQEVAELLVTGLKGHPPIGR